MKGSKKLKHIPIKIRRRIIKLTNKHYKEYNISHAPKNLYQSFIFEDTKEGTLYWAMISRKYKI